MNARYSRIQAGQTQLVMSIQHRLLEFSIVRKSGSEDGYVNTLQHIHDQAEEYQRLHSHFAFGTTQRYYATLIAVVKQL